MTPEERPRDAYETTVPGLQPQSSDPRPSKRRRLEGERDTLHDLYQNIITIYVGPDSHPFRIYKELACRDAKFFETAFNSFFQEAEKQEMSLPDDDVQIFRVYQSWLNTGELRYNFDSEDLWLHLAKLWIFADKICSNVLKNKTIDAFFDIVTRNNDISFATADTVRFVFEHTMSKSSLRRVFVRLFVWLGHCSKHMSAYPVEFLALPLKMYMRSYPWGKWDLPEKWVYHEACLEPCCAMKRVQWNSSG